MKMNTIKIIVFVGCIVGTIAVWRAVAKRRLAQEQRRRQEVNTAIRLGKEVATLFVKYKDLLSRFRKLPISDCQIDELVDQIESEISNIGYNPQEDYAHSVATANKIIEKFKHANEQLRSLLREHAVQE